MIKPELNFVKLIKNCIKVKFLFCLFRNKIDVLDVLNGAAYSMEVPMPIASLHLTAPDAWMVTEVDSTR